MDDLWHAIEDVAYSEALDQADPIQPLRAFSSPPDGPNGEPWNAEAYAAEEGFDCASTVRSQLGSFFFLQFLDLGASAKKRRASVVQITATQAAVVPVTEDCDDGAGIDYSWMMSTNTSDDMEGGADGQGHGTCCSSSRTRYQHGWFPRRP